jgi:hypothetical protein
LEQAESRYRKIVYETAVTDHADVLAKFGLALIAFQRDDRTTAVELLRECLADGPEYVHTRDTLLMIEAAALWLAMEGEFEEAERLIGSVDMIRATTGPVRDPIDRANYDKAVALIGDKVGPGTLMSVAELAQSIVGL